MCLRHRWKMALEAFCIWVCPSVSECLSESVHPGNLVKVHTGTDSKTLWTPCIKNHQREFYLILVTDVFGFIDVLVAFAVKRSKVKATAGNDLKTVWIPYYFLFQVLCLSEASLRCLRSRSHQLTLVYHLLSPQMMEVNFVTCALTECYYQFTVLSFTV